MPEKKWGKNGEKMKKMGKNWKKNEKKMEKIE